MFSGTSASAPVVTGALAATMSDGSGSFLEASRALEIILTHTDDIGPPGVDSEYGAGILNLSRIRNRSLRNMLDAAITDLRLLGNMVQVTIQNRGNVPILNLLLEVTSPSGTRSLTISVFAPNDIKSFEFPIDLSRPASFRVSAGLSFDRQDEDVGPDDNLRIMEFRPRNPGS
jgi:hypothetical protein